MSDTGVVFDIKEFAVFDGPGIRTTVFMKGCPLRCQWCHNPEGLSAAPQLMVSRAMCTQCGACRSVCKSPAECTACGACISACRAGLRRITGERWTAGALAARLMKDEDVYRMSGGGVTFSGGEPLMQWGFVSRVIDKLSGVHTAIETSGYAPDDVFEDMMARVDLVMLDYKVTDPHDHLRYTGVSQERILRHARMLTEGSTPFILRMPVIPGVNDNEAHFAAAAELVKEAKKLVRVDLLPYQRAAGAKYEMVGMQYAAEFEEEYPPQFFTEIFDKNGIPYEVFR